MYMATGRTQTPKKPRPFRWMRAHLDRLPDGGNRYEVLDGALLVSPPAELWHPEGAGQALTIDIARLLS